MATPVVLLAFANDRADGARYLRNLPEERRAILAALDGAAAAGVCEVAALPNATAGELLDAFRRYRDRVAVLHFGGHAGSYALLLEDAAGRPDAAGGEGLAAFLAQQRGLELVVLNACATEGHVRRLLAAGVPAAVATSRAVEDAVALEFARQLYQGLGAGAGVRRAFDEASAAVRLRRGDAPNALLHASPDAPPGAAPNGGARRDVGAEDGDGLAGDGGWPWGLFVREGAERVERWTFAEAAGDPLWGLPPLPARPLPERPFRHLAPFGREHAAVFFGRGAEVRELYDRVTGADGPPVVLLYGQTGVGKSSLLDAGLLPRLEASHAVRYARRDHARGLLGTLAAVLGARDDAAAAVAAAWAGVERATGRPLLVVVDQAEEAFTRAEAGDAPSDAPGGAPNEAPRGAPNGAGPAGAADTPADPARGSVRPSAPAPARELDAFAAAVAELFADPARRPLGRLVLGFRKEWLAEVEGAFAAHRVPRGKQFLGRLTRAGVAAAVTGPARAPALRAQYGLTVEDGLAELIADDLLADRESHVAPVLQILLAGMWDRAVRRSASAPRFDRALYDEARAQGLHLDGFLEQQFAALRAWHAPAVESGLALDYLAAYTTPLGTARERPAAEDAAAYPQAARTPPPGLRARCTELYLLTERAGEAAGEDGPAARLAHDTLAPLVRRRAELSDAPGQRARRALEARAGDWADGREGTPLDDYDLTRVEQGAGGMRAWTPDEVRLVEASRRARATRRREQRRVRRVGAALGALVLALVAYGWVASARATDRANQAESVLLATRSAAFAAESPDLALLAAAAAMERRPGPEARSALVEAGRRARGLALVVPRAPLEQFVADGNFLTFDGRTAVRWDPHTGAERGRAVFAPAVGMDTLAAGAFSPDGATFAGLLEDGDGRAQTVVAQPAGGRPAVLARVPLGDRNQDLPFAWAVAFSGDGTRLVLHHENAGGERQLLVWTRPRPTPGAPAAPFAGPDTVPVAWKAPIYRRSDFVHLAVSPAGRWAAAVGTDGYMVAAPLPAAARPPGADSPAGAPSPAAASRARISRFTGVAQDVVVSDDGVVTVSKETSAASDGLVVVERWDVPHDLVARAWPAVRWYRLDSLSWSALAADARTLTVGDVAGRVTTAPLTADSGADLPLDLPNLRTVDGLRGHVRRAQLSPDGQGVAWGGDGATLLWRLPAPADTLAGGPGRTRVDDPMWLADDGRSFYAMVDDTTRTPLRSWLVGRDRRTGAVDTLLANLGSATGWGDRATTLSPDGRWLVAIPDRSDPPVILRWRLDAEATEWRQRAPDSLTGHALPPPSYERPWQAAAVDDAGDTFVVTDSADGAGALWMLRPGRPARRLAAFAPQASAPAASGGTFAKVDEARGCLVVLDGRNTLRGWDLVTGTPKPACTAPAGPAVTPRYMRLRVRDGRGVLVADDESVSLWDAEASGPSRALPSSGRRTVDAVLAPSGWLYRLTAVDLGHSVVLLDSAAVGDSLLGAEACRLAAVGATRARWEAALPDFDPPKRCGRQ